MPAPRSIRQCASHRAHAHAVQWSDEEKLELEEARDLRHRVRIEKRFLHNRTAPSLHKHVLGPFNEGTDLCCTVCEAHSAGEFVKIPKGEMWRSSRLRRGARPKGSTCKREAGPQTGARAQTQLMKRLRRKLCMSWLYQLICSICVMRKHPKLGEDLLNSRGNVAPAMRVRMLRRRSVVDLGIVS